MKTIRHGWIQKARQVVIGFLVGVSWLVAVRARAATVVEIAAGNADFSTLVAAVQAAGLAETLSGAGPFTVFAPNNAAFAKLPAGTVEALLADPARLRQVLLYHVVPGRVRSTDLKAGPVVTAQGAAARVSLTGGVKIDTATVLAADVEASNGVIHVIDTVILPPPSVVEIAAGNADFSTLVAAVQAAGLAETLSGPGPFTVFAPNNAAFAKLPAGTVEALLADPARLRQVLLYHVVPGRVRSTDLKAGPVVTAQGAAARVSLTGGVKIDTATVLAADLEASNGVIHVIDTVILPPPSVVGIAAGNADFSTLVAAVQAAGLAETLSGPGPFTVFAPNNAAFAKLPSGTVEALLADPARLRQVLLYHVVPGRVRSTDLKAGPVVTAQGAAARVSLTGGVKIDTATVLAADLEASNGVIHVIDTVILPPPSVVEIAAGNPDFSTLVAAVQAAGLADLFRPGREVTVLAPNNAAFAKLPAGTVQALLADTNRLRTVLLYHLVPGRIRSTDLRAGKAVTVQGAALTVGLTNGVTFNSSRVVAADVEGSDGVIHVLDSVLLPPPSILEIAAGNPAFSTLVAAVQAAGLVEALSGPGPFTVFAPDNAAFAKLPAGTVEALLADTNRLRHILLYHLNHGPRLRASDLATGPISTMHGAPARVSVDASAVKVNQASIQAADIEAVNGVIHVLDSVILPAAGFDGLAVSVIAKDGQATVVWPVAEGPGPVLEKAPSPLGPWIRVTGAVTTADGVNKVSVEAGDGAGFFRLVRP